MKLFNTTLAKNDLSRFRDANDALRLLKSLGYELQPEHDELLSSNHVRAWSSAGKSQLRCFFLEMQVVTGKSLYPIFSMCSEKNPLNLIWITSDYRYVFVAAVKRTLPLNSISENASIIPSTLIRRLDIQNLTDHDHVFLEELTRTQESDQAQFVKIHHAFNRIMHTNKADTLNGRHDATSDDSTTDSFYHLRRTLQTHKDSAYSGSWNEKCKHLILPTLKYLGYSSLPFDQPNHSGGTSSAFLLFDTSFETPHLKPIACCVCKDPLLEDDCLGWSAENVPDIISSQFPDEHSFDLTDCRKLIVTDGRIWAVRELNKPNSAGPYFDLYRLLQLDYNKSSPSLSDFQDFQNRFAPKTTVSTNAEIPAASKSVSSTDTTTLINSANELFRPFVQHEADSLTKARSLLFGIFHLLFFELSGRISPTDDLRWNIPDFHRIAFSQMLLKPEKTAEWIKNHLIAYLNMDLSGNICAGTFSGQTPPLQNYIRSLDPKNLLDCVAQAGNLWMKFFGDFQFVHRDSSELFIQFLESVFAPDADTKISDFDATKLKHKISMGLDIVLKTPMSLPDQNDPDDSRRNRKEIEQVLLFYVFDSNPHFGYRLIQVLNLFITTFKKSLEDKHRQALSDILQSIRSTLIQDSHEHGLFLDHRTLTDARLLRLKCIQQCLYGALGSDFSQMAPAVLFSTTGLDNIRFPWIAHHFHQDIDYTIERLEGGASSRPPPVDSLTGLITAARWFTSCEQDFQVCGPDFEFTHRLYNELKKKIGEIFRRHGADYKMPVEQAFPWLFYTKLSAEAGYKKPGTGFDTVLM